MIAKLFIHFKKLNIFMLNYCYKKQNTLFKVHKKAAKNILNNTQGS